MKLKNEYNFVMDKGKLYLKISITECLQKTE